MSKKFYEDQEFSYEETKFNIAFALRNKDLKFPTVEEMEGHIEFKSEIKVLTLPSDQSGKKPKNLFYYHFMHAMQMISH